MSPFLPADLRVRAESALMRSKKIAIRRRKLKQEQIQFGLGDDLLWPSVVTGISIHEIQLRKRRTRS